MRRYEVQCSWTVDYNIIVDLESPDDAFYIVNSMRPDELPGARYVENSLSIDEIICLGDIDENGIFLFIIDEEEGELNCVPTITWSEDPDEMEEANLDENNRFFWMNPLR